MSNNRKLFQAVLTVVLLSVASIHAEQPDKFTKPHEPFTASGMQVRMSIIDPIDKSWRNSHRSTVFQEIAPCRLVSTVDADGYDRPWGGPGFQPNESRSYRGRGLLATPTFVNPCSEVIPPEAIGVVARFTVTPGDGEGEVRVDPVEAAGPKAMTLFKFQKAQVLMFEAGVLLAADGSFAVGTWNAGADVKIDILGYLLDDPAPAAGPKGDKGDKGDAGDKGATGAPGANGDKGDKGERGPAGADGAKGDSGAIGPKGDKGDKGDTGAKGDQGDLGATGPKGDNGAIGPIGPKGDTGATGPIGPKGDTGATGAKGDLGATGAKGDRGDTGAIGPKGDDGVTGPKGDNGEKGEPGPQGHDGVAGPKGDKGDSGPQGPLGLTGPRGPEGPMGPAGRDGHDGRDGFSNLTVMRGNACYPPGNNANSQVTISEASITPNSIVILNYTDAGSNGNAQALTAQGSGYFNTTGSPNRCFQYVVLNAAP